MTPRERSAWALTRVRKEIECERNFGDFFNPPESDIAMHDKTIAECDAALEWLKTLPDEGGDVLEFDCKLAVVTYYPIPDLTYYKLRYEGHGPDRKKWHQGFLKTYPRLRCRLEMIKEKSNDGN